MPGALPVELRERVVSAYSRGEGSQRQLAKRFSVGAASIARWLRQARESGSLEPSKSTGRKRRLSPEQVGRLLELVRAEADLTLVEIADEFFDATGVRVSRQTVGRTLRRAGWTRKKNAARGGS